MVSNFQLKGERDRKLTLHHFSSNVKQPQYLADNRHIQPNISIFLRKTHSIDLGIYVFVRFSRFMQQKDRGINFLGKGERDQKLTIPHFSSSAKQP